MINKKVWQVMKPLKLLLILLTLFLLLFVFAFAEDPVLTILPFTEENNSSPAQETIVAEPELSLLETN